VLLVVAAAAGGLVGCTTGGSGDRLTIYSGRTENLIDPLLSDFADETGIGIDVRYGDSADLALLIDEEGDRSPADVFLSQSPGAIGFLAEQNRLAPIDEAFLDRVEPRFRGDDGRWVGVSGRVRTLVYNTEMVDEADLPASVFDLTEPRFEGQVAVAPTNGSFQDFVTAMRELAGDDATRDWLDGMVANDVRGYANNLAIVEAVGRGEIAMGLVNHYYNEQAQTEDPDIPTANHFFPAEDLGSLILVTAVGVLDTAGDQRDGAERFLEFLLSRAAQRFYVEETSEYPLAAEVPAPPGLPSLDEIQAPDLDLSSLGGELTATKELIEESGIEQS